MTATDEAIELATTVAQAAADKLATDIVLIDVSDRLAITDVFVVATGSNERQVEAIVDAVEERARLAGHKPIRREGQRDGRWVLLDYGDVVAHIQHSEERVFYALERLWKDCPFIPFVDTAVRGDAGAEERAANRAADRQVDRSVGIGNGEAIDMGAEPGTAALPAAE